MPRRRMDPDGAGDGPAEQRGGHEAAARARRVGLRRTAGGRDRAGRRAGPSAPARRAAGRRPPARARPSSGSTVCRRSGSSAPTACHRPLTATAPGRDARALRARRGATDDGEARRGGDPHRTRPATDDPRGDAARGARRGLPARQCHPASRPARRGGRGPVGGGVRLPRVVVRRVPTWSSYEILLQRARARTVTGLLGIADGYLPEVGLVLPIDSVEQHFMTPEQVEETERQHRAYRSAGLHVFGIRPSRMRTDPGGLAPGRARRDRRRGEVADAARAVGSPTCPGPS